MPKGVAKGSVNKSAFIRSMGDAPADQVVKAAAKRGIALTPNTVYAIRAMDKKRAPVRPQPRKAQPTAAKPIAPKLAARTLVGAKAPSRGADDELLFRRLVLSIGLPKAEAYLADLKRSVGL